MSDQRVIFLLCFVVVVSQADRMFGLLHTYYSVTMSYGNFREAYEILIVYLCLLFHFKPFFLARSSPLTLSHFYDGI